MDNAPVRNFLSHLKRAHSTHSTHRGAEGGGSGAGAASKRYATESTRSATIEPQGLRNFSRNGNSVVWRTLFALHNAMRP